MKILAFVDLHGDFKSLKKVIKKGKDVDIVVGAGDLSMFGRDLDLIMKELNKIGKPVLVITGNHEDTGEMKAACKPFKNVKYIDGKVYETNGYAFVGYGGGGFSMTDKSFEKSMAKILKNLEKKKVILVTHQPPYGTIVDKIHGEKAGNKSYTNVIKKMKPKLVICGHLHENAGKKDKIGDSIVINPGWQGAVLVV